MGLRMQKVGLGAVLVASLGAEALAAAQYNISRSDFTRGTYQGSFILKNDPETFSKIFDFENLNLSPDVFGAETRYRLFTSTFLISRQGQESSVLIPDLLYPVKEGTGPETYGLRLIPVYNDGDPNSPLPPPGTQLIDQFLRSIMYGEAKKEDLSKQIYAVVPHSSSFESYYSDFWKMAQVKIETGTGHVSSYTGQGSNSRRQMLYGGSSDNIFTLSLIGVDQEAVNMNTALWTRLYYENPDQYNFAENYKFDWVTGADLQETLAFAKGWLKRDWVRSELNGEIIRRARALHVEKDLGVDENTSYYSMLQKQKFLGLYCFEGVTNAMNLGLNVPLTKAYLSRIFGEGLGLEIFAYADALYQEIQRIDAAAHNATDGQVPADFQPESLESPRVVAALNKMKPLWELPGGVSNAAQYTATNPLFPPRDPTGAVTVGSSNPRRDQEITEVGRSLAWVPETSSEILRDLIYIYAPFHKVGAARTAGLILSFKAQIENRTGIDKEVIKQWGTDVVKLLFKHEAQWTLAKLQAAMPGNPVAWRQAFENYKSITQSGLNQMIDQLKHSDGIHPGDEELLQPTEHGPPPLTRDELQALRDYRKLRNTAAAQEAQAIVNGGIVNTISDVFSETAIDYTSNGDEAFSRFYTEAQVLLAQINAIPVREPNIISQALSGEKYVKYNNRPGLAMAISHGIHPTNPNVKFQVVATVINGKHVEKQLPIPVDEHAQALGRFFSGLSLSNRH